MARAPRIVLATLLLAATGAGGVLVLEPMRARAEIRETLAAHPGFRERLDDTSQSAQHVADAIDRVLERTAALEGFDDWRTREVVVLGRTVVPWERMMRASEVFRLTDDAVDVAIAAVEHLEAIEAAWTGTGQDAQALADALDALERWPTRARVAEVGVHAAALHEALDGVADALTPVQAPLATAVSALDGAQSALEGAEGPIAPVRASVRHALESFDNTWGESVRTLSTRLDVLSEDRDACASLAEAPTRMLFAPSASPHRASADSAEAPNERTDRQNETEQPK